MPLLNRRLPISPKLKSLRFQMPRRQEGRQGAGQRHGAVAALRIGLGEVEARMALLVAEGDVVAGFGVDADDGQPALPRQAAGNRRLLDAPAVFGRRAQQTGQQGTRVIEAGIAVEVHRVGVEVALQRRQHAGLPAACVEQVAGTAAHGLRVGRQQVVQRRRQPRRLAFARGRAVGAQGRGTHAQFRHRLDGAAVGRADGRHHADAARPLGFARQQAADDQAAHRMADQVDPPGLLPRAAGVVAHQRGALDHLVDEGVEALLGIDQRLPPVVGKRVDRHRQ
jgi:hypothetical protein